MKKLTGFQRWHGTERRVMATSVLHRLLRIAVHKLAMVGPDERVAAAAYTNTARYAVRPLGPVAAGALMQHVALAGPFLAAGGLKILYDLVLYRVFRRAQPADAPSRSDPT